MNHLSSRSSTLGCALILAASSSFSTEVNQSTSTADVVCSYAPSQSKAVVAMSGAAGGAAATTAAIGSALGLTAVTHSSGALILSGSGGYIAGTLGAAVVAPVILTIGAIVAGTAVSVELLCAPKNHPSGYKKVVDAAQGFGRMTGNWVQDAKDGLKNVGTQTSAFTSIKITATKDKAGSIYRRVFGKQP